MIAIKEIAEKDFSSISVLDSVESAVDLMEKRKVNYLIVKEKNKIKGIATLQGLAGYPSSRLIVDCPIEKAHFVDEEILLDKALKLLEKEKVNFLIILNKEKEYTWIINREAIVSTLCKELKTLDKLKNEFVNISAHELKTPLTPILGYLDLILKNKNSKISKKEREQLEICFESTIRLKNLTEDILDINKLETGIMKFEMKLVNMKNIINTVVNNLKPAAQKKSLSLTENIQPKLPFINGDPERLIQVLSKFVENAIKFTDIGKIQINARKVEDSIKIEIIDTGIGISKKDIPKLFKKFSQIDTSTTRKAKGTGLGLVISKKIIEAHNGKVWVESKGLGKGSTFGFTLSISKKTIVTKKINPHPNKKLV